MMKQCYLLFSCSNAAVQLSGFKSWMWSQKPINSNLGQGDRGDRGAGAVGDYDVGNMGPWMKDNARL